MSGLLSPGGTKDDKAPSESLRLILVVFLGGCTFSEISALRFLGREKGERGRKGDSRSAGGSGLPRAALGKVLCCPLGTTGCGLESRSPTPGRGQSLCPERGTHTSGPVNWFLDPARAVEGL